MTALAIAVCGAVGSLLRWALSSSLTPTGSRFPVGTLAVNVLGSAAMGLVMAVFAARGALDSRTRMALTVGLLGGFTTYSAFAYDTWALLEAGQLFRAAANAVVTTIACVAGCGGAVLLVQRLAVR